MAAIERAASQYPRTAPDPNQDTSSGYAYGSIIPLPMSIEDALERFRLDQAFMKNVTAWERLPLIEARYADYPQTLDLVGLLRYTFTRQRLWAQLWMVRMWWW
jgi:hypothetical protein